jgi:hypothetical protein
MTTSATPWWNGPLIGALAVTAGIVLKWVIYAVTERGRRRDADRVRFMDQRRAAYSTVIVRTRESLDLMETLAQLSAHEKKVRVELRNSRAQLEEALNMEDPAAKALAIEDVRPEILAHEKEYDRLEEHLNRVRESVGAIEEDLKLALAEVEIIGPESMIDWLDEIAAGVDEPVTHEHIDAFVSAARLDLAGHMANRMRFRRRR